MFVVIQVILYNVSADQISPDEHTITVTGINKTKPLIICMVFSLLPKCTSLDYWQFKEVSRYVTLILMAFFLLKILFTANAGSWICSFKKRNGKLIFAQWIKFSALISGLVFAKFNLQINFSFLKLNFMLLPIEYDSLQSRFHFSKFIFIAQGS